MCFFSGRYLLIWIGLVFLVGNTGASASVDAKHPKHEWNWLSSADEKRLLHSIPPKPAPGSAEDKSDLQGVLKAQAERTPAEIAEAKFDENFRLEMISNVLGPDFTQKNYPVTFALLDRVRQDESLLNSTLKKEYARPRPYQAHPEVKPLFEVGQYSYPSGHSSGSRIWALILGELFPEKKAAFAERADKVAESRVIAGVHYPSDIREGSELSEKLAAALLANPGFQRDLAAAKAEIAARKSGA